MKFKFAFKVHSSILITGTRYITEMEGLVKVKAAYGTLGFLFEFDDSPVWKYLPSNALITGWNEISLDGDDEKIRLTANGHYFTLVDESTAYSLTTVTSSYNHYWATVSVPNLSTANSWEIKTRINYIKNTGSTDPQWIVGNNNGYYTGPQLFVHTDDTIGVYASSGGNGFDLANDWSSQLTLLNNSTYDLSICYDNSNGYYIAVQDINGGSLQTESVTSGVANIYCTSSTFFLGNPIASNLYCRSVQYLDNTTIIIDSETWFDGSTAAIGVDYTNTGCEFTSTEYYPTGKYPDLHTKNLNNYQSWLYLKDIEALRIED